MSDWTKLVESYDRPSKVSGDPQPNGIVAAHRPCEPLPIFDPQGNAVISDRRFIAICRKCGLRRSSQRWTLTDVIGRLRTAASSIPLTRVSHEAMHLVRKGQIEGVGKGDVEGQVRFVESLFKVAA